MVEAVVKKISLWRELWVAIKSSFFANSIGIPCSVGGVILGVFTLVMLYVTGGDRGGGFDEQLTDVHDFLQAHPEFMVQFKSELLAFILWFVAVILLIFSALVLLIFSIYYVMTVQFLRFVMKDNRPELSLNSYFYWLRKMIWKYTRPILWCLLPVIGLFFYVRSIIRYKVVSPLAVLRRYPELKISRDLTQGNEWRIFGNACVLVLGLLLFNGVVIYSTADGCFGVSYIVFISILHFVKHTPLLLVGPFLILGCGVSFSLLVHAIYSCTVYRVLSQEAEVGPQDTPLKPLLQAKNASV